MGYSLLLPEFTTRTRNLTANCGRFCKGQAGNVGSTAAAANTIRGSVLGGSQVGVVATLENRRPRRGKNFIN